ncbi:UxaA family hydrolase [Nordella sp. HKS 07]|uniref:UxaA family hydrolase n=1 Tax=Nordella sp. HKS 07 TaxID=2712222 RepID=UPI0013E1801E|nr:UxaA family hydrolase [Nordella sp. HKS 07]QIG50798.1 UxaA family hydrolase [Nordella sp. HKS 07]
MSAMVNMIVLDGDDNVGIALRDIAANEQACDARGLQLTAGERIVQGHKIALRDIAAGERVIRFTMAVGITTAAIPRGRLVHVHNVKSQYLNNDEDHYE